MKKAILIIILTLTELIFFGCESRTGEIHSISPGIEMVEVDQGIFEIMEPKINAKKQDVKLDSVTQYICGTIQIPTVLKDLNKSEIYTSNILLEMNSNLQVYGFSGAMGKKDILIVSYLTKFKDYDCGDIIKRAQVGLKLYVHASNLKTKVTSPSLPLIAAAVELGLAKAEYKFEVFGISPENLFINFPSAQFTIDTYSKVISAYDEIVHSLKGSTQIDPIITDIPKLEQ